jgi:hypothetical protein
MKKLIIVSLLLVLLVALTSAWVFRDTWSPPSEAGFRIVSLNDNTVLLSDEDVVTFNSTSQEIALTDAASQRLTQFGGSLYSFTNVFALRVNGEEIYQGVFRSAVMSALPASPKIAILYPAMYFPSGLENDHAIRLFYPSFEAPNDLSEETSKFAQYFLEAGKLIS